MCCSEGSCSSGVGVSVAAASIGDQLSFLVGVGGLTSDGTVDICRDVRIKHLIPQRFSKPVNSLMLTTITPVVHLLLHLVRAEELRLRLLRAAGWPEFPTATVAAATEATATVAAGQEATEGEEALAGDSRGLG